MTEKFLEYRGEIQAVAGQGQTVVFVTRHPEDQPTALYRLDAMQLTIEAEALPCGGRAILVADGTVYIAGTDSHIYARGPKDKKPKPLAGPLIGEPGSEPTRLAPLSQDRLAALCGNEVVILSRGDGNTKQTIELPDIGTALAADPTGNWLVVGTEKGQVLVYDAEDKEEFLLSESDKLHEGAVTALLFEPEELRFFSAGVDHKLLVTHARGKLEPEDRGRGGGHEERITAMILGLEDRFFTGSRDGTVKNWTRSGGQRPATQSDGVAKVADLALVEIHSRPHLAVACEDESIRLFLLDPSGKIGQLVHKVFDAYASAKHEFEQNDTTRRTAAVKTLAEYGDTRALELLTARAEEDSDHAIRLLAAQLIGQSKHAKVPGFLEKLLAHNDEAVRLAALEGLRAFYGEQDLRPLEQALAVRKADVGQQVVAALEKLAQKDDQALAMLTGILRQDPKEVRQAALLALESVFDKNSPEASLTALESRHADLRRLALIRLLHRKLLDRPIVQAALRRASEDRDPAVRQTAFQVSLFTRPKLVEALRARDATLHRQLHELETFTLDADAKKKDKEAADKEPPKPKAGKLNLDPGDYEPLLQAMANRSLDTCLAGGRGLAQLGDPRAFGLLLQLSREDDNAARVEVCQALAALGDPRSAERLATLLHDKAAEVRDAAFSALTQIYQKEPLRAVGLGLGAGFEDVRRRGLQLLIREVRKSPPQEAADPGWDLLLRALNDSFETVRGEAFKACVNTSVAGGGVDTLRFVLNSVHEDIRREVLNETMGQYNTNWAPPLLLEFFNDPSAELRREAFEFADKKSKGKDISHLQSAMGSRYPDLRLKATRELSQKHTSAAQKLLIEAINDDDLTVRQEALGAVLDAAGKDVLAQALENKHIDVRLRAAMARAWHGDSAAREPLLKLAAEEEPDEEVHQRAWLKLVPQALLGLEILGDPEVLPQVLSLTDSKHSAIRKAAAGALTSMARAQHRDTLRALLQHDDAEVKYRAALALAYCGDETSAPLVFSKEGSKVLTTQQQMAAAVTLGPVGEDQLIAGLDDDNRELRRTALLLLLLKELTDNDGVPRRCLACLSAKDPRTRLAGAKALRTFGDHEAFAQLIAETFNDREPNEPWTIPPSTVESLSAALTFGPEAIKPRLVQLLEHLSAQEQHAWDLNWSVLAGRYAAELAAAEKQAKSSPPPASTFTPEELAELAFGAYVGLARDQGARQQTARSAAEAARVRQTAMSRLVAMAGESEAYHAAAVPVLVQALGDTNQPVRFQAFESLQQLKVDPARLGSEALQSGHTDLGVAGLKLLTEGASAKEGRAILEQAMLERDDDLAIEAAKLLTESQGVVKISASALEGRNEQLRMRALEWLAAEYEKDDAAKKALAQSLKSRYRTVRRRAAVLLAFKKDPASFDALVELLNSSEKPDQRQAIIALEALGDSRAPAALLDRVENDPSETAEVGQILEIVGNFRQTDVVPRLFKLMEQQRYFDNACAAAYTISGHNQPIEDPEDELPDRAWEEKQHPRHDDVLAAILEKGLSLGVPSVMVLILPDLRWCRGNAVDEPLATAAQHPNDALRRGAVEAIGWRFKKRGSSPDPLIKALAHKDGDTKFLAAEGLARGGRAEGIEVLQAAVELLSDLSLRRRAVSALGELADPRALDLLLKLAAEHGHALQDAAAEAIGRLGKSDKAADIFKLLQRLAEDPDSMIRANAIRGLRWFDTHEGWQLIRKAARGDNYDEVDAAIKQLGYNDTPETRDLLLEIIAKTGSDSDAEMALVSAKRIFPADSLEPDYAWLKNSTLDEPSMPGLGSSLERVCEHGDPQRMLELVPFCDDEDRQKLYVALLRRSPIPVDAAEQVLESNQPAVVEVAARLLGHGSSSPSKKLMKSLETAWDTWRAAWDERRGRMLQANAEEDEALSEITLCLSALVWAGGRLGMAVQKFIDLLPAWPGDAYFSEIRDQAALSLGDAAGEKPTKAVIDALQAATLSESQSLRLTAASILSALPDKSVHVPLELLSDRQTLNRLLAGDVQPPQEFAAALTDANQQPIVLPWAVDEAQIEPLAAVMEDAKAAEFARLGAIEGLGKIASADAAARLAKFGAAEKDEDLRKAAFRARRRSLRAQQKDSSGEEGEGSATKTATATKAKKKTTRKKKK